MNSDIELVRQAVARDSDAFIAVAGGVRDRLYRTAYTILNSDADALDAVDETMYNAWRSIHKLREPKYFVTWITRILINQCNKTLKRRKREIVYESIEQIPAEYFDGFPIREALARLPSELRIIIGLRYFADMTVPDIADMLSMPQGTVKSRQRKALALLRLEMEDEQ